MVFVDVGHDLDDVTQQLFGKRGANSGFVDSYASRIDYVEADLNYKGQVMKCFSSKRVPVITTLAKEFVVCDHWHSSVPGPTWPNRFFTHAATCAGWLGDVKRLDLRTIFQNLADPGKSWKIYYHDFSVTLWLQQLEQFPQNFAKYDQFKADAAAGNLPNYAFIEPCYGTLLDIIANDQHPDHDVLRGEHLIAETYAAVRSSPKWEKSLLMVTYDEHGGLYDHVFPPQGPPHAVNPGDPDSMACRFKFDRLGVRVPMVMISPYIEKGKVDDTIYDHTSIAATLKERFGLPNFLTKRDEAANTFESILTRSAPRTDAR